MRSASVDYRDPNAFGGRLTRDLGGSADAALRRSVPHGYHDLALLQ
jgi:hypothetical protein